jgi:hypothetical protein
MRARGTPTSPPLLAHPPVPSLIRHSHTPVLSRTQWGVDATLAHLLPLSPNGDISELPCGLPGRIVPAGDPKGLRRSSRHLGPRRDAPVPPPTRQFARQGPRSREPGACTHTEASRPAQPSLERSQKSTALPSTAGALQELNHAGRSFHRVFRTRSPANPGRMTTLDARFSTPSTTDRLPGGKGMASSIEQTRRPFCEPVLDTRGWSPIRGPTARAAVTVWPSLVVAGQTWASRRGPRAMPGSCPHRGDTLPDEERVSRRMARGTRRSATPQ